MTVQKLHAGAFVFGITGGIWGLGFLLVQHVLRIEVNPAIAYAVLMLPVLYFYGWSEYARLRRQNTALPHATAVFLLILILILYAVPLLMSALLLPEYRPGFLHYPHHAPVILGIGLLLIRLHAVEGKKFSIFLGLLATIVALFFLATRIPEWILGEISRQAMGKTFEFFALVLTGISYLFLFISGPSGLLKITLIKFASIPETLWPPLRQFLISTLLIGCHVFLLVSLVFLQDQQLLAVALLLLAGLWIATAHLFRQMFFYWFAYIEIVAAIYSCRFASAYWSESWILWLLLGHLLCLFALYGLWLKPRDEYALGKLYAWWGLTALLMVVEYVIEHGLGTRVGLIPLIIVWATGFLLPADMHVRTDAMFQRLLGGWLYIPAAFIFLLQGYPALAHLPRTLLAALIISGAIIAYRVYEWEWIAEKDTEELRVFHHVHWFLIQPYSMLWMFVVLTLAALSMHVFSLVAGTGLFTKHLFSMLLVQGTLVVYWSDLARKRKIWWATVAAELMVMGVLFSLRRGIPSLFGLSWSTHWDMLIGWFVAVSIVATRSLLQAQDKSIRMPIRVTLFGLPIITAMYALDYRVDFEFFALIVLPLYSLLFLFQSYSERDRFVLSYAFVGINSYLILLFLHQQLHSVQLYVTPVCISVLILVEVFRDITSTATANLVRGMALTLLLGVAMVQAVVSNALSPLAHLIVLTLGSLLIAAANFLKVRVFAVFGLFSFVLDLVAILYIVLSQQHLEALMVILGSGLTIIGFLTLGGYYVYRQQKDTIDALFASLKTRFQSWE